LSRLHIGQAWYQQRLGNPRMAAAQPLPLMRNDRDLEDSDDEAPLPMMGRAAFCASSFRESLQLYEQVADYAQDSFTCVGMPWQGVSVDDLPEYQDVGNRDDSFTLSQGFVNKSNFNDLPLEIINTQDMEAKSVHDLPQCQVAKVHGDFFHLPVSKINTQGTQSFANNIDVNDLPQGRSNIQDEDKDAETTGSFHIVPPNRSTGLDGVRVDATPDSQEELSDDFFIARGSAILWMRARSSDSQGTNEENSAQAASSSGPNPTPTPPPAPPDRSGYRRPSGHGGHRSNALPKS